MTSRSATPSGHVSVFELDLLEARALEVERARGVNEHLKVCAECRDEQAALRGAHTEFVSEVFPRTASQFGARLQRVPVPLHRRPMVVAPFLATAAALVLAIHLGVFEQRTSGESGEVQAKGGAGLSIVARRNGRHIPINGSSAELRAGDELRFVALSVGDRARYLLIVSIDGAGKGSVYFPSRGETSGSIEHGGRWEVPGSVVLDASPGPERIFALFSSEPLDARPVLEQLSRVSKKGWESIRRTVQLEIPAVEQHAFLVEKTADQSP